jgi:hypothetical protein
MLSDYTTLHSNERLRYSTSPTNYCTSLFHLLGAGGKPPFAGPLDPGLELGPSDGAGAGLMGRFMMFWPELLDDVRAGYGRGGAGADAGAGACALLEPFDTCDLTSAGSLLSGSLRSGGGAAGSRSFSFMVAAGAVGAR